VTRKHQFEQIQFDASTLARAKQVREEVNDLRYVEAQLRLQATYFAYASKPASNVQRQQEQLLKQASSMSAQQFAQAWQMTVDADSSHSKLLDEYKKAATNFAAFWPNEDIKLITSNIDSYIAKQRQQQAS
jgi:hypothetical protein